MPDLYCIKGTASTATEIGCFIIAVAKLLQLLTSVNPDTLKTPPSIWHVWYFPV